jgi:hypothetical protein
MPTYGGSCVINAANVVIDSMVVNCDLRLTSGASGFVLRNSYLNGSVSQATGTPSFTVEDTFVDGGVSKPACSGGFCSAGKYACLDCGIDGSNFTVRRTEVINTNRAARCDVNCLIEDSWFHGTNLWPDPSNVAHASGMRESEYGTIRHNTLACDYPGPDPNGELGCSADLTGYPDFAPVHHNTVDHNLFIANPGEGGNGFCAYGGATGGKDYSNDPLNATFQVFTNNVFQRGTDPGENGLHQCGQYGPITSFDTTRTGNVWSGNRWDDGAAVPPEN